MPMTAPAGPAVPRPSWEPGWTRRSRCRQRQSIPPAGTRLNWAPSWDGCLASPGPSGCPQWESSDTGSSWAAANATGDGWRHSPPLGWERGRVFHEVPARVWSRRAAWRQVNMLGFVVLSSAPEREKKQVNQCNAQATALASLMLTIRMGFVKIVFWFKGDWSTEEDLDPQTFKLRNSTTHSICLLGTNTPTVCWGTDPGLWFSLGSLQNLRVVWIERDL